METYKQSRQSLVKQDLVISAYRPSEELEKTFGLGASGGVRAFLEEHLRNLPVFSGTKQFAEAMPERQPHLLFDRMLAAHVQRGLSIPASWPEFLRELGRHFIERDEMYFLPSQVAEYDRKRARAEEVRQLELFVTDEVTAIRWLRTHLLRRPQLLRELQPRFMRETQAWARHERTVELREVLEQNFLRYDGVGPVPSQIHSYLSTNFKDLRNKGKESSSLKAKAKGRWYVPDPNKQADLEKLRDRALLREFEVYKTSKQHRLNKFRSEALRAGFKTAYEARDYETIVGVSAKIPETLLQEDEKLLMYYDVASMRLGKE